MEQELLSISEYLSSPSICCRVHISRPLVFCLIFCKPLFLILFIFFGHCIVVCHSSYGYLLSLWYHQTLLSRDQLYFVLFCFVFVCLCSVSCTNFFHFSLLVLSVFSNVNSTTICDDSFDRKEAQVICSMLGYDRNGYSFY